MDKLYKIVEEKLYTLVKSKGKSLHSSTFLLMLSGGSDSIALLSCLNKLKLNFFTIHFNHGILDNAVEVSLFCQNMSNNFNSHHHFTIKLKKINIKNVEYKGREKRYSISNKIAQKLNIDFILSAHHLDDQIETLIMREVKDNNWVSSLGIQEVYGKTLRPLLSVKKSHIIHYLKKYNIDWIEDISNNDNRYQRNKVRNVELPSLSLVSPDLISTIIKSNQFAKEKFEKINADISSGKIQFTVTSYGLKIPNIELENYSNIELKFIIQLMVKWMNQEFQTSKSNWESIINYLNFDGQRKSPFFMNKFLSIYKGRSEIYLLNRDALENNEAKLLDNQRWFDGRFIIETNTPFHNDKTKNSISVPKNLKSLKIRQWKNGDKMVSSNDGTLKKVSDLFINSKLNYVEKCIKPIVVNNSGHIVWIPGISHSNLNKTTKYNKITWASNAE